MIPVNEPLLDGNEKKYLQACIDTGWISSEGPFIKKFEEDFSKICDRKHGVAVCNGTAALEVAVQVLELQPGDEVIMPAFTIISCAVAVLKAGAVPVLVDMHEDTWNMDTSQIEKKITPRTKAIMAVHIYGLPADMDAILQLAQKHKLLVIEDAAEAHGLKYKERPCGSFGDISIFSFYPNKLITTGEGGMVLTNDDKLAGKCRSLRNLCFLPERRFVHEELGWNMRMTNLQAALGLAQLEKWEEHIARKRKMGRLYTQLLSDVKDISIPVSRTACAENIYWVFGIMLRNGMTADTVMKRLAEKKIGTRPFFYPMHQQPVLQKKGLFAGEAYPVSEKLYKYGFYLPSGLTLTEEQITQVAEALKEIVTGDESI